MTLDMFAAVSAERLHTPIARPRQPIARTTTAADMAKKDTAPLCGTSSKKRAPPEFHQSCGVTHKESAS
eukprot:2334641-Amphidinium_carterae.1